MTFCRESAAIVLLFCVTPAAQAHRQHISWTSISWNERTGSLEIVHRFHQHDVQIYLNRFVGKAVSATDLKGHAQFAVYLSNHFQIRVKPEITASVDLLGAELESQYMMVYQEIALKEPPMVLDVHAEILMDQFPDQVNMVNIDIKGTKRTMRFSRGDASKQFAAAHME